MVNRGPVGYELPPRKHHCPKHNEECKAVKFIPTKGSAHMMYNCPQGCRLGKGHTVLK